MPVRPPYAQVARAPRMIGLLLVLLLVAAVCGRLGAWQLDRARERAEASSAASRPDPAVPLAEVLAPQEAFTGSLVGRAVTVDGEWSDDGVLVRRPLDGRDGWWVVTRLDVEGAALAVVRGWTPDRGAVPAAPSGAAELRGRLEAGEHTADVGGEPTTVSPAELVNRWGGPIYSGYLVLDEAPAGLAAVPVPEPDAGWDIQNLAYAVQWWIFGGAAVLLWLRMVRDEARHRVEGAADDGEAADDGARPGAEVDVTPDAGGDASP